METSVIRAARAGQEVPARKVDEVAMRVISTHRLIPNRGLTPTRLTAGMEEKEGKAGREVSAVTARTEARVVTELIAFAVLREALATVAPAGRPAGALEAVGEATAAPAVMAEKAELSPLKSRTTSWGRF